MILVITEHLSSISDQYNMKIMQSFAMSNEQHKTSFFEILNLKFNAVFI